MRYFVTVEGRTLEVDLTDDVPRVDGEPVPGDLARPTGSPIRHLLVDGRSYALVARRHDRHTWELHLAGERLDVDVVDERTHAIRAMTARTAAVQGPRPVRAPMPGLVVRVNVEVGDRVSEGQSVVIIEAMKMENDLKSEGDGVVTRVAVSGGEPVEKGAVLVELEAVKADGG